MAMMRLFAPGLATTGPLFRRRAAHIGPPSSYPPPPPPPHHPQFDVTKLRAFAVAAFVFYLCIYANTQTLKVLG